MENLQNDIEALTIEQQRFDDLYEWEIKIDELIQRNNYGYYKSRNEIHYGPPPEWTDPVPNHSMEVFIGALPRDVTIMELIALIDEHLGVDCIYELSVMLDTSHSFSATKITRNRGFAFVTFKSKELAQNCRELLDNLEIRPGKSIRMNQSTPNLHLFVANVPSNKTREELLHDLREYTDGLIDVMIFAAKTGNGDMDSNRHRGFVFLEYETHSAAANGRRKLSKPGFRLWNRELKVDWAAKKQEPSEEIMCKVKSIYVRNLTAECTDQNLKDYFTKFGEIESIKKVRDFAFVHFKERSSAIEALEESNKVILPSNISNGTIDVELVKPNINSQYRSIGFPFANLLNSPFLPYPYGLPLPPPTHLLPPPQLMYEMTNPAHFALSNKNRPWPFMNGLKNSHLFNSRQMKQTALSNRHVPLCDTGSYNKWTNSNNDIQRSMNSSVRYGVPVGASGDNPGNSPTNNLDDHQANTFTGINDVNKRLKALKESNSCNPQAFFYWGMNPNEFMYRDSPFMGW